MQGKTVVCVGSGPSLTEHDCELVQQSGHPVIAVNNAWESAWFADIIFGGDGPWWDNNIHKITIPADRWTSSDIAAAKYNLRFFRPQGSDWHSGLRAIQLAVHLGAARVLLLGYDCSVAKGVHFHGKHEKTSNPTKGVCQSWREQLKRLAPQLKIPVINCSRSTALTAFPLSTLEDELCLTLSPDAERPKMSLNSAVS